MYSDIIAGCMSWGKWGKQFSKQEMIAQIQLTIEAGITTFDHADIYGDYSTEQEFGDAFVQSGINRESIQLISKCGIQLVGNTRKTKTKHYNTSKEYIIWSVEQSLKNLQTDYLDVLLIHRPNPLMDPNEISEAIHTLKEAGKILDFGVSNFTPSQLLLVESKTPISVNQIEFSLTQHQAIYQGVLDQLFVKKIRPMSWSPLGNYFKEKNKKNEEIRKVMKKLTDKYHATEDQLLLAWILNHPSRVIPVIGTTNKNRLEKAVQSLNIKLELEDWFVLLEKSQGHPVL